VQERPADGGALLHAAGELERIDLLEPGEPYEPEQLGGAGAVFGQRQPADFRLQHHVAENGAPLHQGRSLEDETDVALRPAHGGTVQQHLAAGGRVQPGHDLQQRALAAAAGSDQRDELARPRREPDVLQRVDGLAVGEVDLAEVANRDESGQ
jgi:hypothetical protein